MNFLDQITNYIIRPVRDRYSLDILGQNKFIVKSKIDDEDLKIKREDPVISNKYNQRICTSLFKINKQNNETNPFPYIIYLHSNGGSRYQGLYYVHSLLQNQFNVALFDCTGSGYSDGQYVTLGLRQSQDLQSIVDYLINKQKTKSFAFWGRSMGAVTALLYSNKHITQLKACIYDSPFSDLKKLIKQLANKMVGLPQYFFTPFMDIIEQRIRVKTGVSISDLELKNKIKSIQCPGCFVASKNDQFIDYHHTQMLYNEYPAQKQILYIDKEHNEQRSKRTVNDCIQFIKLNFKRSDREQKLCKKKQLEKKIMPCPIFLHLSYMETTTESQSNHNNKKLNLSKKMEKKSIHSISTNSIHGLLSNKKEELVNKKSIKLSISKDHSFSLKHNNNVLYERSNQQKVIDLKKSNIDASFTEIIQYKNKFVYRMDIQNNKIINFSKQYHKLNNSKISKS